jgi:hypothetical protein
MKAKKCAYPGCKETHKSEGHYCAEHAEEEFRGRRISRNLKRYGVDRACPEPHLAEEEDFNVDMKHSILRNVL